MKFDAYTRAILNYLIERNGQTVLIKDIATDTLISPKTIQKKIAVLEESGYLVKAGKKFYVLKNEWGIDIDG